MKRVCRSIGSITLGWLIGSCGGGDKVVGPPPPPTVASVTVSSDTATLVPAATVQFSATAKSASGELLQRSFSWSTSDPAKVTVSTSGMVAGVAPGTATITAAVDGKSATATITVLDGGVVSSAGGTLNVGSGAVQIVVPADALTSNTNVSVSGSSAFANDPRVIKGTPFDFGPTGTSFAKPVVLKIKYDPANLPSGTEEAALELYLRTSSGWQVVPGSTADIASKVVSAPVSHFSTYALLTPEAVAAITISGEKPIVNGASSLVVGGSEQLTATLTAADGRVLSNRVVTWLSSDATIASVSSTGVLAALKPGSATISASAGGKTSSVVITVNPVPPMPVATVSVTPTSASLVVGGTQQLTAVTKDGAGTVLTGRVVTWSSSNLAVATVDVNGLVTAVAAGGPVTITATSSEGVSGTSVSGTSSITVTLVPVATVTLSAPATPMVVGGTQVLTAVTKDGAGTVLTGRTVNWVSSNTSVLTVSAASSVSTSSGATVTVTAAGPGTAAITASSETAPSATTPIITVPVPVATVRVSPASASLVVGGKQQLMATLRDATNNVLTGRVVTWISSNPAAATVDGSGLVTAVAASGPVTITATSETKTGTSSITVSPAVASGPLRVSAVNRRYFADPSGRVVYLTGSEYWKTIEDNGLTSPPPVFDYSAFLDFLQRHNHNFTRLYTEENARWSSLTSVDHYWSPNPYVRTGPDTALDGAPKFDLAQINPAYLARVRQRVIDAGARGIYVSVMLFNGWSIEMKPGATANNPWRSHPFNAANNINGINGDTNGDQSGAEIQTLSIPAVTAIEEAYVKAVIDAVNDLDNVIYEISNESDQPADAWQYHMIDLIRNYELTKPKQHPIGMTVPYPTVPSGTNVDVLSSTADWVSMNGDFTNPAVADGSKVSLSDTDHLCGICGDAAWPWRTLTRGHNALLMDGYDGSPGYGDPAYNPSDPIWEAIRTNMGYARSYALRMDLAHALPSLDLASSGYCLAVVGSEYLVFLPTGGSVVVNLSGVSGSRTVEWFNPTNGQTIIAGTPVLGGGTVTLTAPFSGMAAVYIHP